ncbi:hypothetical protein VTJ04DRAFT_1559 [Mycothermus thermophilus]|uniref:uncharacterized protein n=1 Tax=Humicola insolens TaxID=85995 RepID=UPI00374215CB
MRSHTRNHSLRVLLTTTLAALTAAHSWPESTLRLAPNGTMIGAPGYDRNHIEDGDASFKVPPPGQKRVAPHHKIVRAGALTDASYTAKYPMLSVAPGDWVAIRYRENGHVSRADSEPMPKPVNRGTVYLYGTTQNDLTDVNLMDVHLKWTADGTGGDGKGRLLATRHYDDGQCHEAVPISGDIAGIVDYRSNFTGVPALLCQSDVQIPADIPVGTIYSVIWVWDWATLDRWGVAVPPATWEFETGNPKITENQFYTGVVDYKIVDPCDPVLGSVKGPTCGSESNLASGSAKGSRIPPQFIIDQPADNRGIPSQMAEPFLVRLPQAGFKVRSATADPDSIPFAPIIGKSRKPVLPWAAGVLAAQNTPRVDGAGNGGGKFPAAPTPSPTPTETTERNVPTMTAVPTTVTIAPPPTITTSTTTRPDEAREGVVVMTETATVPEAVVTVTVTAEAAEATQFRIRGRGPVGRWW